MKANIPSTLLTFVLIFFTSFAFSQKDVYFKINHLMGKKPFEFGMVGYNNIQQPFSFSRLDYYISNITLYHDNGQSTLAKDVFLLIRKNGEINQKLGDFNIGTLDSISFNIGIDTTLNHGDPTLWPADHPLSPKDPDMHWGWAAGYKFVVLEGKNGEDNLDFEMHAFGDAILSKAVIPAKGKISDNKLEIVLDADYEKIMTGVELSNVILIHGVNKYVRSVMKNFATSIFTEAAGISSASESPINEVSVYPNPICSDKVFVQVKDANHSHHILVKDSYGRLISAINHVSDTNEITLSNSGIYYIQIIDAQKIIHTSALIRL